ncbi:zinc finger protein 697-like [Pollicipes pollicipes]|uniref:zinc finger protein 697-like n=1 Tax=Pollicipes pollicipes TaxID=41117 RepID=UPI001885738B|nr:zinc finger protein 697-like [Pollicipes pollicipes]
MVGRAGGTGALLSRPSGSHALLWLFLGWRCVCDLCGRSYKSRVYLRRHRASHFGSTRCPFCGVVYSTAWNLRVHIQASYSQHVAMHRGRTTCHVCQAVYGTRFGLRRHMAQRHPEHELRRQRAVQGRPPRWLAQYHAFPCATCGRAFGSRRVLSRHEELHRGLTTCPRCHRVFSCKMALRAHVRHSCRETGTGPGPVLRPGQGWRPGVVRFSCETCGQQFSQRSNLCHHRAVHQGRTRCTLCGRVFSRMSGLNAHMVFSRKGNMQAHLKSVHAAEAAVAAVVRAPPSDGFASP